MRISHIMAAAAASCGWAMAANAAFVAYNDMSLGTGIPANTTTWGAPNGPGGTGLLKDSATGLDTPVTIAVVSNNGGTGGSGPVAEFTAGTPAANQFGANIVNTNTSPILIYGSTGWSFDVQFRGLDASRTYRVSTTLDRGDSSPAPAGGYPDRWSKITLVNGDGSATEATTGGEWHVPGGGISIQSYNTVNGYIAQWTNINPGPDGLVTLHFAGAANTPGADIPLGATENGDRGYGPSAVKLEELGAVPEPASLSVLALGTLGLLARARRRTA